MVLIESRLVVGALLALASAAANAAPFPSTDQNPLLGGFSFTAPARLAPAKQTNVELGLNWSSTAAIQQSGNDALTIDAESREWRLQVEHTFGEHFSARVQLPYRTTDGGTLDSVIENWHSLFGLPNGDRSQLARNQLHIDYRRGSTTLLSYGDSSYSGIGDVVIDLGWQLRASEVSATSIWSSVSLPTGDVEKLSGTGAFAGSLIVAHTRKISSRFEVFGHVGASLRGASDLLSDEQESTIWLAMIGTDYRTTANLTLTLQLDAHSATFADAGLDMMGSAYILSFGGEYAFPTGWRLQFGVAEDIKVEASPDVSFLVRVKKSL